ncbi:MAG: hypothetical protein J5597_02515 [Spirochaetaceae bacterium]|nr:hypothetical protein [Spirochaetaceae bacterium]
MKQYFKIIFLTLLVICMFSSFSLPPKKVVVRGYIKFYGNEPFAFLGVDTVDGKQYKIVVENEKQLSDLQGYLLKIEGTVKKNSKKNPAFDSLKDGTLTVDSYSIEEF